MSREAIKEALAKNAESHASKKEAQKPEPKKASSRRSSGPFVDKQLDKALEVIRSKLEPKAKAA